MGACLALVAGLALAAPPSAAVSWTAPTTNTDGSAIAGTVTYNLYQGLSGALVKVQSAVASTSTTVTTGLTAGTTQCFAVTAVANGMEGPQSTSACAAVPFSVPGAPTQVTVVIH